MSDMKKYYDENRQKIWDAVGNEYLSNAYNALVRDYQDALQAEEDADEDVKEDAEYFNEDRTNELRQEAYQKSVRVANVAMNKRWRLQKEIDAFCNHMTRLYKLAKRQDTCAECERKLTKKDGEQRLCKKCRPKMLVGS